MFSWRVLSSAALHRLPLRSLWERERTEGSLTVRMRVCVCVQKGKVMEVE